MGNVINLILDYILEGVVFLGLFIVALITSTIMTSKEIKTWVKTTVFLVLSESFAAFIGWMGWQSYCDGNQVGAFGGAAIAFVLAIVFIVTAILGHKKEWRHVDF